MRLIILTAVAVGAFWAGFFYGRGEGEIRGYRLCVSESDDDHPKVRLF